MGVSRLRVKLKAKLTDFYELIVEVTSLKMFWVVVALTTLVLVLRPSVYEGTSVSRGVSGVTVDMHNQMVAYQDMKKEYHAKTGDVVTPAMLDSHETRTVARKNYKTYPNLTPEQMYNRLLFKPYVIKGQVVMKIMMNEGPDFLEISSNGNIYAIYFIDSLPPQVKGDNIEVTGIVYGTVVSGKTKETALVASYKNVEFYTDISQP